MLSPHFFAFSHRCWYLVFSLFRHTNIFHRRKYAKLLQNMVESFLSCFKTKSFFPTQTMYFGLPANDVCSNVLLFIDNVEKLKVACCKKLTSRTMWKTQEVGIESFVCNDLRPSELYRASTIDHPNSTVHRPSTIRTLPCIDHRPSRFKKRASDIELPSSVLLWTSADGPKMEPRSKSWTSDTYTSMQTSEGGALGVRAV